MKIQSCLNECSAISFTSDFWSGLTESFISLTAHGIGKKWNRLKFVLCVRHFPGSHTAETIGEAVNSMLEDWGIDRSKCHVFLRDEGSNMKKAFEDVLFLHADCGAHKPNLVVRNSLFKDPDIKAVPKKCRSLVGYFNHSNLASDRLKKEQANFGTKIRKLLQDVATRWNSTHTMCKRLRKEKTAIELYLTRYDKRNLALSSEDWQVVEQIEKLLEPLKSASDAICQDSVPLSVQFPIARALTSDVHAIRDPELLYVRGELLASYRLLRQVWRVSSSFPWRGTFSTTHDPI